MARKANEPSGKVKRIEVAGLLREGLTPEQVARRMGWKRTEPVYDNAPPDWFGRRRPGSRARSRVRRLTGEAIKAGRLVRPDACEVCGAPEPEAHHDDYDQPLDVRWLCRACHLAAHRTRDEAIDELRGLDPGDPYPEAA